MKKEDLLNDAINVLETLQHWNDDKNYDGPPTPETMLEQELVKYGLIKRVTLPSANRPGVVSIVGHMITDKGRAILALPSHQAKIPAISGILDQ